MEYYSASQKKEILQYSTTWLQLEGLMRTWKKPDTGQMPPVIWRMEKSHTEAESRMAVARGWAEGQREGISDRVQRLNHARVVSASEFLYTAVRGAVLRQPCVVCLKVC